MYIEQIENTNIYAFKVDGIIETEDMKELNAFFKEHEGKVNLLVKMEKFIGFESLQTLLEGLKVDFSAFNKINRYAVLSDKKWVENMGKIENFLIPGISIKVFHSDELTEALAWLQQ